MHLDRRTFFTTLDCSPEEFRGLLEYARAIKAGRAAPPLERRVATLIFFNPSVRTRLSCESAMARFGGAAVSLQPGKDTWNFEHGEGVVMDGETQEHVRELAPVVSRLCDVVGIRKADLATIGGRSAAAPSERRDVPGAAQAGEDGFLERFAAFADVPVVNLESNRWHPLQGLADAATLQERFPDPRGKKYVLTWSWHPKALPVATPHSQLLAAAQLGMQVTLLRPEGFGLDPAVVAAARERAEAAGGSLRETDDVEGAYAGAHAVCAKAWGAPGFAGRSVEEERAKAPLRARWIVDGEKMARTSDACFLHCLPVRRNVVVTDAVLDSRQSAVVDQAENRLWTAAAVLGALVRR